MKRCFSFIVSFSIIACPCLSQQARQYTFTHLSSFNGLSSNFVNNVVQDKKGFIWIATYDGLQRYDGNRFLTFRNDPLDSTTVPGDIINKVLIDKKGNLWLWAGEKVGIFNTSSFTYLDKAISGNSKKAPMRLRFLDDDEKGNATIFVHEKGIYTFSEKQNQFIQTAYLPLVSKEWFFIDYYHEPFSGNYFFTSMNGLAIYNSTTGNLNYRGHNPDNNSLIKDLENEKFLIDFYGRQNDIIWFSTWPSVGGAPFIVSFNIKTKERNQYSMERMFKIGYFEITGAMLQQNGRMWFHGSTFISIYTGGKQPFNIIRSEYKDEQSIKYDKVSSMYEDRQHNIWVSTDNGLFVFNPDTQVFNSYDLLRTDGSGVVDGPAVCGLQLKDGRVFVGAWGTGLYVYDSAFNIIPLPPSLQNFKEPYSIWCMLQHRSTGLVWMGVQGGSLIVYDPVSGKGENFAPEIFRGSTIRQVTEDSAGNLWFGMQGGHIVKWDKKAANNDVHKGFVLIKERDGAFINKMFADNSGYVWAASTANGVFKFDAATNNEAEHFTINSSDGKNLWSNTNNDILQYNDSLLLIAAGAINVFNIKTNKISYITSKDGLPSNTVYCFQKDKNGILWVGMAHGLCQANIEKKIFTRYDRRDGLRYDNFNTASAFKLLDGRIVFATDHSLIEFNPEKITAAPKPPNAVITDFKLANKSLPVDSILQAGKISLRYDNTSIAIQFSALNFIQQNKLHYHYMLEGVDKSWRETEGVNEAVYSHLPSGTFTFKVKAENSDGVASDKITTLSIRVIPPFWRTWWFLSLLVFAVLGIILWFDKLRMQKIRATESIRTRIATSLTEDMSSSLSTINITSELAKTKVDNDVQRTKEYISQISESTNRMGKAMHDMVWSIDPQNDTMQHTLDRMKAFAVETGKLYEAEIVVYAGDNVSELRLNMEQRYEVLSIFKEALTNAAKHSHGRYIYVRIRYKNSKLTLEIQDDGKGFNADAFSLARGITEMRRRAAAIQANLNIKSEMNTGTTVCVEMNI